MFALLTLSIGSYALIEGEGTVKITDLNNIEVNPSHTMNVKLGNREATLSTPANINVEDREITLGENGIIEVIGNDQTSRLKKRSADDGTITLSDNEIILNTNSAITAYHQEGEEITRIVVEDGEPIKITEGEITEYSMNDNSFMTKDISAQVQMIFDTSQEFFNEENERAILDEGTGTVAMGNPYVLLNVNENYEEIIEWLQDELWATNIAIKESNAAFIDQVNRIELMYQNPHLITQEGNIDTTLRNIPQFDGINDDFVTRVSSAQNEEMQDPRTRQMMSYLYDAQNNQAYTMYPSQNIALETETRRSRFIQNDFAIGTYNLVRGFGIQHQNQQTSFTTRGSETGQGSIVKLEILPTNQRIILTYSW